VARVHAAVRHRADAVRARRSERLHGLKIVAVAVVAQAVWGMARSLCPDRERATIAILAAIAVLAVPNAIGQLLTIAVAGLVGWRLLPVIAVPPHTASAPPLSRRTGVIAWVLFFGFLFGLPLLRLASPSQGVALFDSFYRVGSLVFGGGHVVLPLLAAEVVPTGWVSNEAFIAGYGAAQAIPGPLFTFSAYLGVMMAQPPNGLAGGILALIAIFLPSFFLVVGALPFWEVARTRPGFQSALRGVNAAVVGLLGAALYNPVWISAILGPTDLILALAAFGLLMFWKTPPWLVVMLSAVAGAAVGALTG
jgi:chromate transporter